MEGSLSDDLGAPESWEGADLDATMTRLGLSSSSSSNLDSNSPHQLSESDSGSNSLSSSSSLYKVSDDVLGQVDQFLREALQNPRERLSILRMEQDVEKFICDPTQQQLEFQQLPTSYLRLAAHRVAQHYSLQSMVLLDNNLPDGSGSRIIVRKTSECRLPMIRLADIPVNLPSVESSGAVKVAIKQRPQKKSQTAGNSNSNLLKSNSSKSVEERKEEYNRARARIFNSNNFSGGESRRPKNETKLPDGPLGSQIKMDLFSPTTTTNTPLKSPFTHFYTNQSPASILSLPPPRRPSLQLILTPPSAPRLRRCLAASPVPPPSDPPPQQNPVQLTGFSRLQDRIQIFFAVLFWMSLFFWASAFDKRDNGRRTKRSRFRR